LAQLSDGKDLKEIPCCRLHKPESERTDDLKCEEREDATATDLNEDEQALHREEGDEIDLIQDPLEGPSESGPVSAWDIRF
jgi:hypothetical protein